MATAIKATKARIRITTMISMANTMTSLVSSKAMGTSMAMLITTNRAFHLNQYLI